MYPSSKGKVPVRELRFSSEYVLAWVKSSINNWELIIDGRIHSKYYVLNIQNSYHSIRWMENPFSHFHDSKASNTDTKRPTLLMQKEEKGNSLKITI